MERKQFSLTIFCLLTLTIHFAVVLLLSSRVVLSNSLSLTFAATAFGFYLAKIVTKNSKRTWAELLWFQILNFAGTLVGAGIAGAGVKSWQVGSFVFAFVVSAVIFWFQKSFNTEAIKAGP